VANSAAVMVLPTIEMRPLFSTASSLFADADDSDDDCVEHCVAMSILRNNDPEDVDDADDADDEALDSSCISLDEDELSEESMVLCFYI
jgi:hypothetical protein